MRNKSKITKKNVKPAPPFLVLMEITSCIARMIRKIAWCLSASQIHFKHHWQKNHTISVHGINRTCQLTSKTNTYTKGPSTQLMPEYFENRHSGSVCDGIITVLGYCCGAYYVWALQGTELLPIISVMWTFLSASEAPSVTLCITQILLIRLLIPKVIFFYFLIILWKTDQPLSYS